MSFCTLGKSVSLYCIVHWGAIPSSFHATLIKIYIKFSTLFTHFVLKDKSSLSPALCDRLRGLRLAWLTPQYILLIYYIMILFSSTLRFQMYPQMACMRGCKVALVTFVWVFPKCACRVHFAIGWEEWPGLTNIYICQDMCHTANISDDKYIFHKDVLGCHNTYAWQRENSHSL